MPTIQIDSECGLASYLRAQSIPLKMSCGGHGSCRTCRVILDGESVLSCQTRVVPGSYEISLPRSSASSENIQIDLELEHGITAAHPRWSERTIDVPTAESQPNIPNRSRLEQALPGDLRIASHCFDGVSSDAMEGRVNFACFDNILWHPVTDRRRRAYAIAVDIGTTTIAAALVDLETRQIVACQGRLNGQYAYAEDLVARIAFCSTPDLLQEMQDLVLKRTLRPLLHRLLKQAEVPSDEVVTTVLAGNATMIHLLLGLDPTGMGGWPFNGVDYAPVSRPAAESRLPGHRIEFIPAKSAYLGGDIISGLALLDFATADDGTLLVDLGTNAEMVLKAGGELFGTAVPAGPSFEGGGFPCGVSAIPGAIDHVWEENGQLVHTTVGGLPAIGICGSGIIAFVAAAFRAGILKKKGRYARRHPKVEVCELLGEQERVYRLAEDIYVSETDISNFLQAKAAVFSGIVTLCRVAGIGIGDLTKLYLAGNFGRRIHVADIIDIGVIPPIAEQRISVCGNTSLKGAIYATVDRDAGARMAQLVQQLTFVELNAEPTFQDDFIDALFLPHLKLTFPR